MQERRGRRRQESGHAEDDQTKVEADDEAVIAVDAAHEGLADSAQRDKLEQILRRDGDVGDLPRDSRAGRNGDARVGLRQGRGVVHAVADHDNGAARSLFPADERGLVLRQDLGVEFVHADLFRDGRGSPAVIAGHHDDLADAAGVQRADSVLCLGAQRVEDADDGGTTTSAALRSVCLSHVWLPLRLLSKIPESKIVA